MSKLKEQKTIQLDPPATEITPLGQDSTDSLSETQLCVRWARSPSSLNNWRKAGRMPPHFRRGQQVRYRLADILEFEKKSEQ
jgi:hypothetical protein